MKTSPLLRFVAAVICVTGALAPAVHTAQAAVVPWGTVLVPGAAWAGPYANLGDLNVYSNGDGSEDRPNSYGLGYECVELATRWAAIRYGVSPWSWHISSAYQMFDVAPRLPIPFESLPNGGAAGPQFGDILVFDQVSWDPTGHVAVVSGVGPGYVNVVEQNWGNSNPTGTARLVINGTYMPPRFGLPIRGWVRPSSTPFVNRAYQDILNRVAEPTGLMSWTSVIDRGMSRTAAAAAMINSWEGRVIAVNSAYTTYLGRQGDSGGLAGWALDVSRGDTREGVAAGVLASAEYGSKHGGTNDGFVVGLYTDILHRAPDPAGRAAWNAMLARGVSRAALAHALLTTPEADQSRVAAFYTTYLRRSVDGVGLASWSVLLTRGVRDEQVEASLLGSDEYLAFANAH